MAQEREAAKDEGAGPPFPVLLLDLPKERRGALGGAGEASGSRSRVQPYRLSPGHEACALADPGNPPGSGQRCEQVDGTVERQGPGMQRWLSAHARVAAISCAA